MREILFRGKLRDGNWCYGFYLKATNHWNKNGIHEDWIVESAIQNGGYLNVCARRAVIAETVGQFTGLTDKNGKKIFEGDIVVDQFHVTAVVEFTTEGVGSCGCCYPAFGGSGFKAKETYLDACEIIGNIHDNPELLEEA